MKPFPARPRAWQLAACVFALVALGPAGAQPELGPEADPAIDLVLSRPTPARDPDEELGRAFEVDLSVAPELADREVALELIGLHAERAFEIVLTTAGGCGHMLPDSFFEEAADPIWVSRAVDPTFRPTCPPLDDPGSFAECESVGDVKERLREQLRNLPSLPGDEESAPPKPGSKVICRLGRRLPPRFSDTWS